MFRRSLLERRCVVPTTGFYEWDRKKTKYRFRLLGRNRLYLACLWNLFRGEKRFVILTTAPNDTIINVHDRIPVLLTHDEVMPWLHDTEMASAKLTAIQPALEHVAVWVMSKAYLQAENSFHLDNASIGNFFPSPSR